MTTAVLSVMHFLVDFLCAWAMFGSFLAEEQGYLNILIYNLCAFALQMPLGTALDLAGSRVSGKLRQYLGIIWTGAGVALTVLGALTHPAVLGLGNALFHVGGGLDVIREDSAKERKGRNLGIFVAPGALGLYLGTRLGKTNAGMLTLPVLAVLLVLLLGVLLRQNRCMPAREVTAQGKTKGVGTVALCCFAVVILRSWVGLAVSFDWKAEPGLGLMTVLCVVLGKMLGGFAAARFGTAGTVRWSLVLAAVCYLLGEHPAFGLAALLLFNMSMPVTLYLLAQELPAMPGFSFGLLTFGLFLGFLPVYGGVELPVPETWFGATGSLFSLLLLMPAGKAVRHGASV